MKLNKVGYLYITSSKVALFVYLYARSVFYFLLYLRAQKSIAFYLSRKTLARENEIRKKQTNNKTVYLYFYDIARSAATARVKFN